MRWPCLHWGREMFTFLSSKFTRRIVALSAWPGCWLKCRISGFTPDLPVGICYLTRSLDNSHTQSILRSTALDPLGGSTCKNTIYFFCSIWMKIYKTFETMLVRLIVYIMSIPVILVQASFYHLCCYSAENRRVGWTWLSQPLTLWVQFLWPLLVPVLTPSYVRMSLPPVPTESGLSVTADVNMSLGATVAVY